jgi:hypothetical protein
MGISAQQNAGRKTLTMTYILAALLAQFLILALLLIHRPRVIQQLGQFFVDVADLRITGGRRHYRVRSERRRGAGRGSEPARAEVPGLERMRDDLASALEGLGAPKRMARETASFVLAKQGPNHSFDELLRSALQESTRVN